MSVGLPESVSCQFCGTMATATRTMCPTCRRRLRAPVPDAAVDYVVPDGSTQARPTRPIGWYRDPRGPGIRLWDGDQWTDRTRPFPTEEEQASWGSSRRSAASDAIEGASEDGDERHTDWVKSTEPLVTSVSASPWTPPRSHGEERSDTAHAAAFGREAFTHAVAPALTTTSVLEPETPSPPTRSTRAKLLVGVGAVALVAVVGIAVGARGSPRRAANVKVDPTTAFVSYVHAAAVGRLLKAAPDPNLAALGQGVCAKLTSVGPATVDADMLKTGRGTDFPAADAKTVIVAAGKYLCPSHGANIQTWAGAATQAPPAAAATPPPPAVSLNTLPPVTVPPVTAPPVTDPPVTDPPVTVPLAGGSPSLTATQFLPLLRSADTSLSLIPDEALIAIGNGVCSDFQHGATVAAVIDDGASAIVTYPGVVTARQLGEIIFAAATTLCPTYGPEVRAWLAQSGYGGSGSTGAAV
jgi:hypothetical protein